MTPPLSLVRDLHTFDPRLRLRWARHRKMWLIEVKCAERQPSFLGERPNPLRANPINQDRWESWQQGYLHVTYVHPNNLRWDIIAPFLRSHALNETVDTIERRLNELEAEEERSQDRAWAVQNEAFAKELYENIAWADGRRASLYNPDPLAMMEEHDGFRVVDRRVKV